MELFRRLNEVGESSITIFTQLIASFLELAKLREVILDVLCRQ